MKTADFSNLSQEQLGIVTHYQNELISILKFGKRSKRTIIAYQTYAVPFLVYCFESLHKSPENACEDDVREFLEELQEERGLSDRTINHAASEIHFLFSAVLNLSWNPYKVPFRKFNQYIAFVPEKSEMQQLLAVIDDPKLLAMTAIMYACGLRIIEVCMLKFGDICYNSRKQIYVAPSKNHKARFVDLPDNCMRLINSYASQARKEGVWGECLSASSWLFPEQRSSDKSMYPQFVTMQLPKYEALLGWPHRFSSHTFRRAFATHNYMDGNLSIHELSLALGHANDTVTYTYIEQSLRYLKPARRKNAIDDMEV